MMSVLRDRQPSQVYERRKPKPVAAFPIAGFWLEPVGQS